MNGHDSKKVGSYRGVNIFKYTENLVNLKETKNGIKELKPKVVVHGYGWAGGYPYDTKDELKESIDKMLMTELNPDDVVEILNNPL